jgi:hypothetical protein
MRKVVGDPTTPAKMLAAPTNQEVDRVRELIERRSSIAKRGQQALAILGRRRM